MKKSLFTFGAVSLIILGAALTAISRDKTVTTEQNPAAAAAPTKTETATLAAGCFWCVEAVFESIDGVLSAESGYTGGKFPDPTYERVCAPARKDDSGNHAEAVEVVFDPELISYEEVLEWFWRMHDPTTINRQGADKGSQYRSAVYYHNDQQKEIAERLKKQLAPNFDGPIVTQIEKAEKFYPAEKEHQDYFSRNPTAGYCSVVIAPKLRKLKLK